MITYFKMKHAEWKLKLEMYKAAASIVSERTNIVNLVKDLYLSLKDTPVEDLQSKFIESVAEIVHRENQKEE